jgi:hypothetical protein
MLFGKPMPSGDDMTRLAIRDARKTDRTELARLIAQLGYDAT